MAAPIVLTLPWLHTLKRLLSDQRNTWLTDQEYQRILVKYVPAYTQPLQYQLRSIGDGFWMSTSGEVALWDPQVADLSDNQLYIVDANGSLQVMTPVLSGTVSTSPAFADDQDTSQTLIDTTKDFSAIAPGTLVALPATNTIVPVLEVLATDKLLTAALPGAQPYRAGTAYTLATSPGSDTTELRILTGRPIDVSAVVIELIETLRMHRAQQTSKGGPAGFEAPNQSFEALGIVLESLLGVTYG